MPCKSNWTGSAAVASAALAFTLLAAPSAVAQPRWGRAKPPRAGACFYKDDRFRGEYFCVEAGDALSSLPSGMNDEVTSIQTFGNAEVEIYQDVNFRGHSNRFGSSVSNLGDFGWNDRLSSLRVNNRRGGGNGDRSAGGMTQAHAEEIVRRAYLSVLKREPDPASRAFVDRVLNERWTQVDVERELRKSDEYRNKR
jgi:hypothetical protein